MSLRQPMSTIDCGAATRRTHLGLSEDLSKSIDLIVFPPIVAILGYISFLGTLYVFLDAKVLKRLLVVVRAFLVCCHYLGRK